MNILLWLGIAYAAYCGLLFLLQRTMIFPRQMIPEIDVEWGDAPPVEKIQLSMHFGKVDAFYLGPGGAPESVPRPVVIFAHGNAERIDFCVPELTPFTKWRIGVLLVEFPGYGRSAGKPSEKSIVATFKTAYDAVTRRRDVDPDRVVLYGRSLGGGAVCALSGERPAAALILVSTFTSIRTFAKRYLAPPFLIRDPFDNLEAVGNFSGPVLIFHGKHDEIIPHHHGESLSGAAAVGKFVSLNCGHNDCPPDHVRFWLEIEKFLDSAGLIDPIPRDAGS